MIAVWAKKYSAGIAVNFNVWYKELYVILASLTWTGEDIRGYNI
jgi:hypothetical protein